MNVTLLRERAVHEEHDPTLGRTIWARQVDPSPDTELIHHWMNRPHVEEFWEMAWPQDWIQDYLQRNYDDPSRTAFLGFVDETPVGYLEVYDPSQDVLGAHYPVQAGDVGAHVLIGEEDYLGRYSVALGRSANRFLFTNPQVQRIVGEPDIRNHNFLSLLAFLGYRKEAEIDLPDKRAALMVCDRAAFNRLQSRPRRTTR